MAATADAYLDSEADSDGDDGYIPPVVPMVLLRDEEDLDSRFSEDEESAAVPFELRRVPVYNPEQIGSASTSAGAASQTQAVPLIEIPTAENQSYESHDISWSSVPQRSAKRVFRRGRDVQPFGLTSKADLPADQVGLAAAHWSLFLPDSLLGRVVRCTNIEGRLQIKEKWEDLDVIELKAFLGLWYLIGIHGYRDLPSDDLYSTECDYGSVLAPTVMPRRRFRELKRCLRFDVQSDRTGDDPLEPIAETFAEFVDCCKSVYLPGKDVTVDEAMADFRGRCSFVMYMPAKPCKYGIKIWCVCDSSNNYLWNAQIYKGRKAGDPPETNLGQRVVTELTDGLCHAGRTVTCDNYFTSIPLAQELLSKSTYLVGTIRPIRKGVPSEFVKSSVPQE